jgi:hypothetical protein
MNAKKIIVAAVAALAVGGSLGGTALATSGTKVPTKSEPVAAVDNDSIQQGDQTTPDAPNAPNPGAASTATARSESSGESPETAGESETTSDGPGGHQDPPGQNVDHQFDGEE